MRRALSGPKRRVPARAVLDASRKKQFFEFLQAELETDVEQLADLLENLVPLAMGG